MLALTPVPTGRGFTIPAPALDSLRLHSRRRFLTPDDALAWFLTAPWTQAKQNHGTFCPSCLSTSSCRKSCPIGGKNSTGG